MADVEAEGGAAAMYAIEPPKTSATPPHVKGGSATPCPRIPRERRRRPRARGEVGEEQRGARQEGGARAVRVVAAGGGFGAGEGSFLRASSLPARTDRMHVHTRGERGVRSRSEETSVVVVVRNDWVTPSASSSSVI